MKKSSKVIFQLTTTLTPLEYLYNNVQCNTKQTRKGDDTLKYSDSVKECNGI